MFRFWDVKNNNDTVAKFSFLIWSKLNLSFFSLISTVFTKSIIHSHFFSFFFKFQLEQFPRSRAALSLIGYCYYHLQNFTQAAIIYERLVRVCPNIDEYRIYHAQSLLKSGMYPEAKRVASKISSKQLSQRIAMLLVNIKFEQEELGACQTSLIHNCLQDDPETIIGLAAVAFKQGNAEDALRIIIWIVFVNAIHSSLHFLPVLIDIDDTIVVM